MPTSIRPLRQAKRPRRRGAVLVWFATLLVVLLGLVGLVVDGGMMMSNQRQAQNAADAAALAVAFDRMRGGSIGDAQTTANTFVQNYNGLSGAPAPTVNIPPATGPYAGNSNYVEVIVSSPMQTSFIQLLGVSRDQVTTGRAVAGYELHSAGEGVMVLDPAARPGLDVGGQATLKVLGRVVVNSEGGGYDENNVPINNGNNGYAAKHNGNVASDVGIYATLIDVVGGVNEPTKFKPYVAGDPDPLKTRSLPEPDPLLNLPTPTTSTGVDDTRRGSVSVSSGNADLGSMSSTSNPPVFTEGRNYKVPVNPPMGYDMSVANGLHTVVPGEVVLFPGIYDSISISGGTVYFTPGIYVIAPTQNISDALKITGTGTVVEAKYVMFYNTSKSYSPGNGAPDVNDGSNSQTLPNDEYRGGFAINTGTSFTPIDKAINYGAMYTGARNVSSEFDGMLFYQRRRIKKSIDITGNSSDGILKGTLYAKWALFSISGQGTYDAQFIAGSMSVTGNGTVTILGAGKQRGKANAVFLVE